MSATIHSFPIRRLPPAEPQRTTCDAGRPRVASLRCAGTFSSWLGLRRGKQTRAKAGGAMDRVSPRWYRDIPHSWSSARPAQANLSTAHHAPFARARNTSKIVASPDLLNHRIARESGRATYINRRHLLTAICVSWTIAVVAGVALIGALI